MAKIGKILYSLGFWDKNNWYGGQMAGEPHPGMGKTWEKEKLFPGNCLRLPVLGPAMFDREREKTI